jgi:hypothetical protein
MHFTYLHDIYRKQRAYERKFLNEHKTMLFKDNKQKTMFMASIIILKNSFFSLKHCNLQNLGASMSDEITQVRKKKMSIVTEELDAG